MIRYRIDVVDVHAHLYDITLTVAEPDAEQRLSLPVWIPGSYLVREFARHLQGLVATQGSRAIDLEQLDKCTWLARCSGRGALTLRYRAYAFDASVRTAWLDSQRGFFNGTSLCLRVEGREREPHELQIGTLPREWQVATAMGAVKVDARGRGSYLAADYDELVDHPFELGRFWRGRFKAHGVPHEFVVAGAQPGFDGDRLLADSKRICEAQIALWHGESDAGGKLRVKKPPFGHYLFMLNATDEGYGGLEHRASTALIAPRRDLPRAETPKATLPDGYLQLLGLISHEYFHTWNVKRLKPAAFTAYDYTRENHTELLWFFEGFTSYYDDLVLVRAGLVDQTRYLRLLAKTVNQVLGTPGRAAQSVAQASFDAWTRYYRPDENSVNSTVSYYTKGSLVALCIDLTLRREGRTTLDGVLRELWRRSGAARGEGGINEADLLTVLQELGGRSFAPELQAWVHGTGELPLAELLGPFGVNWREEAPVVAQRLGARMADSAGVLKLQSVLRGGAAERAGLAAGDELIAVNGWRVRRADDLLPAGAFAGAAELLAARDQRLLTLRLEPANPAPGGAVQLSPMPAPEPAAADRRAAWLGEPRR
ncbi:M61 family metallopeptidase [Rivibacter subsaxonicus]|uniref:Putative metalloprotease with PDZ domain n=1 Tax=Rivibacter subsaxonicus TaxID=457575 RepID=A0A4Q7VGP9_9BURK|nr:PDZ domain-containing protein [Rivibacter subsaxonicus]RZT95220.1 putative metalloprotease with PDZ domain [Rivibacter subsaxonicus]